MYNKLLNIITSLSEVLKVDGNGMNHIYYNVLIMRLSSSLWLLQKNNNQKVKCMAHSKKSYIHGFVCKL